MAASFLGAGAGMSDDGVDALNASLSPDIVSSTPFLLELLSMSVPGGGEESEKIDLGCLFGQSVFSLVELRYGTSGYGNKLVKIVVCR